MDKVRAKLREEEKARGMPSLSSLSAALMPCERLAGFGGISGRTPLAVPVQHATCNVGPGDADPPRNHPCDAFRCAGRFASLPSRARAATRRSERCRLGSRTGQRGSPAFRNDSYERFRVRRVGVHCRLCLPRVRTSHCWSPTVLCRRSRDARCQARGKPFRSNLRQYSQRHSW